MKFISNVLLTAAVVAVAAACSCTMPKDCMVDFETETTPMMKATVVNKLQVPSSSYDWYVFQHNAQFRGCEPSGDHFVVKTPKKESKCGLDFEEGTCYLLTVRMAGSSTPPPSVAATGLDVYSAISCYYNKPWESIKYKTKTALYDAPVHACDTYAV